jgi:hypothetical protein
MNAPRFLAFGHDTIECSYYLRPSASCALDFDQLAATREALRSAKQAEPREIELGGMAFLLSPHGTKSGYPFLMSNADMTISFGQFNSPSFFVKYHSIALWREGIESLHRKFTGWAQRIGFDMEKSETLARADFTFDYQLAAIDFDEDSIVSLATKDAKHRGNKTLQGLQFGAGDVVLRIYDKIKEIAEKSHKTWFFPIWGVSEGVWRIEWQVRKDLLRRFGIRSVADLFENQGDALRYLAHEHDTLRIKGEDSNRSRWPLHSLWTDLHQRIDSLASTGIYREIDQGALLEERLSRIAISVYGYLKQAAAILSIEQERQRIGPKEATRKIGDLIDTIHDPLSWACDVDKRISLLRLGTQ